MERNRGASYGGTVTAGIERSEGREGNGRCVRCFLAVVDRTRCVQTRCQLLIAGRVPSTRSWMAGKVPFVFPRDIGNCFCVLSSLWRICLFGRVSVWEVGVLVLPHRGRVVRTQQQCLSLYLRRHALGQIWRFRDEVPHVLRTSLRFYCRGWGEQEQPGFYGQSGILAKLANNNFPNST